MDDDEENGEEYKHFERSTEFTSNERRRIRRMLEDHERARWFWSSIGVAAKWVASVGAATAVIIAAVKWGLGELIKWRP